MLRECLRIVAICPSGKSHAQDAVLSEQSRAARNSPPGKSSGSGCGGSRRRRARVSRTQRRRLRPCAGASSAPRLQRRCRDLDSEARACRARLSDNACHVSLDQNQVSNVNFDQTATEHTQCAYPSNHSMLLCDVPQHDVSRHVSPCRVASPGVVKCLSSSVISHALSSGTKYPFQASDDPRSCP